MNIIDISWPISNEITTYKNKADVKIEQTRRFGENQMRESKITCGMHTGTHVDAPAHFLENGKTLDQMDLTKLIGITKIFDMTYVDEKITVSDLVALNFENCQIPLFKTKNSNHSATDDFDPNFIYIDASAAKFLAKQNITAVGIDGLGVERNQPEHETHKALFEKDILIIEGLRLKDVAPGYYQLFCLPLNVMGSDGAPARAILIF